MSQPFKWEFRNRFRTNAFGWKGSKLAIERIKEAVKEIRKTKDPILRAEGALLLMERLWPALQQIDSSSGALGSATNAAVHELVQLMDKEKILQRISALAEDPQTEEFVRQQIKRALGLPPR